MKNVHRYLPWILVFIAFFWLGWRYYKKEANKKMVEENYFFAVGKISNYGYRGTYRNYYLTYSFKVGDELYSKLTSIPYKLFPDCEYDFSICSDKEFWIAYEIGNPSNSLINLDIEIQGIEDPVPPKNLDGFR
ncbi:MAG: hypothetical protein KDC79_13615 [Cyclobacteriaceae bacterium]|nr:hypothetical protein [Cyclobacteriaceae bacterium]